MQWIDKHFCTPSEWRLHDQVFLCGQHSKSHQLSVSSYISGFFTTQLYTHTHLNDFIYYSPLFGYFLIYAFNL